MLNRKMCSLAFIATTLLLAAGCSQTDQDTASAANDNSGTISADASPKKPAVADEKMVEAVENRQAVFKLIKQNFVPIYLMQDEKIPFNATAAKTHADRLEMLIGMIEENFKTDTRNQGVVSDSLDPIWEEAEKFQQKIEAAKVASSNLALATASLDELKPAFGRMGKACGSCHDDFRQDDD